ncbi:MAG: VTT domain-containing protein [Planctomycetota bacterium]
MSLRSRLLLVVLGILALLLVPYLLWHEPMDAYFSSAAYHQWLQSARSYAWLIAIALLVADLFLPMPAPPVMATLGVIYGTVWGGLIGAGGSILAGLVAYGLARWAGYKAARFLGSQRDIAALRRVFDTWGGGAIIISRALPVLPEVLTFLAGLAPMRFGRFCLALVLGSVPVGLLLAWAGNSAGVSATSLLILTAIPAGLWCLYILFMARAAGRQAKTSQCDGSAFE